MTKRLLLIVALSTTGLVQSGFVFADQADEMLLQAEEGMRSDARALAERLGVTYWHGMSTDEVLRVHQKQVGDQMLLAAERDSLQDMLQRESVEQAEICRGALHD